VFVSFFSGGDGCPEHWEGGDRGWLISNDNFIESFSSAGIVFVHQRIDDFPVGSIPSDNTTFFLCMNNIFSVNEVFCTLFIILLFCRAFFCFTQGFYTHCTKASNQVSPPDKSRQVTGLFSLIIILSDDILVFQSLFMPF
jgi:hypothetical protein